MQRRATWSVDEDESHPPSLASQLVVEERSDAVDHEGAHPKPLPSMVSFPFLDEGALKWMMRLEAKQDVAFALVASAAAAAAVVLVGVTRGFSQVV